ncbi:MAG: SRPBCC domain-containing protein [Acidobacteria bacterium]|nr:SRPBCC domain-containing protein [Acidobacteriota bacterium]
MERISFSENIEASAERVWKILWEDGSYRDWTRVFREDSHAVSDWEEGSKIHFLDSKGSGMYSIIDRKIQDQFMSFKHIGEIKNGEEQPVDKNSTWSGGIESYKLTETGGITELLVETDVIEDFKDFMLEKFPLALARVKELSEK